MMGRLIDAEKYPCNNCTVSYCYKNCKKHDAWLEGCDYDTEKVVAELEDKFEQTVAEILDKTGSDFTIADFNVKRYSDRICEIVRKGGAE